MARGHRTHGLHVPSATAGPASYAAPSAMAESWTPANQGELGTGRDSPGPLEMLSVDETGHALGNGLQKEGGLDRCFQHGLGSSVKTCDQRRKEVSTSILAVCRALHAFLPDLKGHHVMVPSDSMTVMAYIMNHQGGLSSL